jgi:hypothetical protein
LINANYGQGARFHVSLTGIQRTAAAIYHELTAKEKMPSSGLLNSLPELGVLIFSAARVFSH